MWPNKAGGNDRKICGAAFPHGRCSDVTRLVVNPAAVASNTGPSADCFRTIPAVGGIDHRGGVDAE